MTICTAATPASAPWALCRAAHTSALPLPPLNLTDCPRLGLCRWALTVAMLRGEPLPPLPALPGRYVIGRWSIDEPKRNGIVTAAIQTHLVRRGGSDVMRHIAAAVARKSRGLIGLHSAGDDLKHMLDAGELVEDDAGVVRIVCATWSEQ